MRSSLIRFGVGARDEGVPHHTQGREDSARGLALSNSSSVTPESVADANAEMSLCGRPWAIALAIAAPPGRLLNPF